MSLILRVDLDKPYGVSNLFFRVISKLRENLYFPKVHALGYLNDLEEFLDVLDSNDILAYIYLRNCTIPDDNLYVKLSKHKVGLHAENTQTLESFRKEIGFFKSKMKGYHVESFSKHGSGKVKLGKHHYPDYEPQKYRKWMKELDVEFLFGNGIYSKNGKNNNTKEYLENIYWLKYDATNQPTLPEIVKIAKREDVVILIHPENYKKVTAINERFHKLIEIAKLQNVAWKYYERS